MRCGARKKKFQRKQLDQILAVHSSAPFPLVGKKNTKQNTQRCVEVATLSMILQVAYLFLVASLRWPIVLCLTVVLDRLPSAVGSHAKDHFLTPLSFAAQLGL